MLHILWMILKFILILLGAVLGLIMLLILLVLFCPVCYGFSASKEAAEPLKQIRVNGRVSWLFRGISLKASYKDGNLEQDVFLFGISLGKILSGLRRRKKRRSPEKTESRSGDLTKDTFSGKESEPEVKRESEVIFEPEDGFETEPEPQVQKERGISPESSKTETKEKAKEKAKEKEKAKAAKSTPRSEKTHRKKPAIKKISLTIRSICDKIKKQKTFFSNQHTKDALSLIWSDAKGLIIHVLPTRIEGRITFGCEDPSITGTILAILGISVPFHKNKIAVKPLFEDRNVLEGQVQAKGRIFVCVLVKIAIEVYFNKNVKYIINQWKHKEG